MTYTKKMAKENKIMLSFATDIFESNRFRITSEDFDKMRTEYPEVTTDRLRRILSKAIRIHRGNSKS